MPVTRTCRYKNIILESGYHISYIFYAGKNMFIDMNIAYKNILDI